MAGWLPENFGEEMAEDRARRAVGAVRRRARRRRQLQAALSGLCVLCLAALAFVVLGTGVPEPSRQVALAPPASVTPAAAAAPAPTGTPDITLQKSDHTVELAWAGDPAKEYVVYRCTSPRFDACSTAGVVRGTRFEDREINQAPLVFYKVEPRGNS